MTKLATLTAAVLVSLAAPVSVLATTSNKPYQLKHPKHEHCRAHYVKRLEAHRVHGKRVKQTWCVYVAPKIETSGTAPAVAPPATAPAATTAKPSYSLHARLDPSFTQDPADPLDVTYSYSASAETLSENIAQATPSLPSGVLAFYSEGLLACSIDVGGETTGGECAVAYSTFGAHSIDAVYSSGEASATTGVETVQVQPPPAIPTTTTEESTPDGCETVTHPYGLSHVTFYSCAYTLTATTTGAPAPSPGHTAFDISAEGTYLGSATPLDTTPSCEVILSRVVNPEREQLLEEGAKVGFIVVLASPDCELSGERKLLTGWVSQEITLSKSLEVGWTATAVFSDPEVTLAYPLGWEASEGEAEPLG